MIPARPRRRKRLLAAFAFILLALLTLAALGVAIVSFLGRRDWQAVRTELLARGEKLSLVELAPPEVPADQNFFADPIWKPIPFSSKKDDHPGSTPFELLDSPLTSAETERLRTKFPRELSRKDSSRTDIARTLESHIRNDPNNSSFNIAAAHFIDDILVPLEPALVHVVQLLDRRGARSSLDFVDPLRPDGEYYPGLWPIAAALSARGQARLQLDQPTAAAGDVIALLRFGEKLHAEPLLFPQILRFGVINNALRIIVTGITTHAWSGNDLLDFQRALAPIDILPGMALAFRGERGLANQAFEALRTSHPPHSSERLSFPEPVKSLYLATVAAGDQADRNRRTQEILDIIEAVPRHGWDQKAFDAVTKAPNRYFTLTPLSDNFVHLFKDQPLIAALEQNILRQTTIACALERYRLAHGEYPASLVPLVPDWIERLPVDVLTLQPMHYQRTAEGNFQLWAPTKDPNSESRWPDSWPVTEKTL